MRGLRTARLPPPMVWSLKSEREHSPPCSGLRQGAKACRSSSLQLPAAACSSLQPCSPAALQAAAGSGQQAGQQRAMTQARPPRQRFHNNNTACIGFGMFGIGLYMLDIGFTIFIQVMLCFIQVSYSYLCRCIICCLHDLIASLYICYIVSYVLRNGFQIGFM